MTDEQAVIMILRLASIDDGIKELLALSKSKKAGKVAPVVDLDVPTNDPLIKAKDPRDWSGPTMQGRHFSETSPEYLTLLAERYDYFASKEPDPQKKQYNQLDAARARAWAARLKEKPAQPAMTAADIPFGGAEEKPPEW